MELLFYAMLAIFRSAFGWQPVSYTHLPLQPEEPADPNKALSPDEIAALFASMGTDVYKRQGYLYVGKYTHQIHTG